MPQIQHEINLFEDRIKVDYQDIEVFKQKLKEQKQMLKDAYENDAEYADMMEEMKEQRRKMKAVKDRIDNDPSVALLKAKIDDYKENIKESQLSLFDNLESYVRQTGIRTIDLGMDTKKIVPRYKLVSERNAHVNFNNA